MRHERRASPHPPPPVSVLGSAEPGTPAHERAGEAGGLLMALAGDACIVIGGRAAAIAEVCLARSTAAPLEQPLRGLGLART